MKNPLTTAGIESATSRFVAQHLNHCATAVPSYYIIRHANLLSDQRLYIGADQLAPPLTFYLEKLVYN
jgi:hypothetical protein